MNILITGGACSGKTTCIENSVKLLKNRGYNVIVHEEIPTKMILNGETPEKLGNMEFLKEVIKRQLEQIKNIDKNEKCINIYDGSPIDAIKFITKEDLEKILDEYNISFNEIINFYDYIIQLESVSKKMPDLYSNKNNIARTLDVKKSAERDERLLEIYSIHKNRYIISVCETFEDKLVKFNNVIDNILKIY